MHKKHLSKKKIIIAIIIIVAALLIAFFFPKADGHSGETNSKCSCIGFESDNINPDGSWKSTCFGIPISCVEYSNIEKNAAPMPKQ